MKVCDCLDISYDEIKDVIKKEGGNKELIISMFEIGSACGCCTRDTCKKVDLTIDEAIAKALKE